MTHKIRDSASKCPGVWVPAPKEYGHICYICRLAINSWAGSVVKITLQKLNSGNSVTLRFHADCREKFPKRNKEEWAQKGYVLLQEWIELPPDQEPKPEPRARPTQEFIDSRFRFEPIAPPTPEELESALQEQLERERKEHAAIEEEAKAEAAARLKDAMRGWPSRSKPSTSEPNVYSIYEHLLSLDLDAVYRDELSPNDWLLWKLDIYRLLLAENIEWLKDLDKPELSDLPNIRVWGQGLGLRRALANAADRGFPMTGFRTALETTLRKLNGEPWVKAEKAKLQNLAFSDTQLDSANDTQEHFDQALALRNALKTINDKLKQRAESYIQTRYPELTDEQWKEQQELQRLALTEVPGLRLTPLEKKVIPVWIDCRNNGRETARKLADVLSKSTVATVVRDFKNKVRGLITEQKKRGQRPANLLLTFLGRMPATGEEVDYDNTVSVADFITGEGVDIRTARGSFDRPSGYNRVRGTAKDSETEGSFWDDYHEYDDPDGG